MKKIMKYVLFIGILIGAVIVVSNMMIIQSGKKRIVSLSTLQAHQSDCILILGAGVWNGNQPSPMLRDRLEEGIRLYKEGVSHKILVSGDHGQVNYDEVNVMKNYLIEAGIDSEDIFMDHAGFSTYESMYRAKEIFGVEKMVVVTQRYHMYRSLYICKQLGIDALGSCADPRAYAGQTYRNIREMIARDKDMITCLLKVKPTYLGDKIDIHGNGDLTND